MKTFIDTEGRTWNVEINYASLRRVKAAAGVDLTRLVDPNSDVIGRLTGDPFVLFDCLAAVLQPQLAEHGITAEQFGEALDEESAEKGAMALIGFPFSPRRLTVPVESARVMSISPARLRLHHIILKA